MSNMLIIGMQAASYFAWIRGCRVEMTFDDKTMSALRVTAWSATVSGSLVLG